MVYALWLGRVWVAFAPSRVHCFHFGNGSYRDPLPLDCGCSGAQTWRELSKPGERKAKFDLDDVHGFSAPRSSAPIVRNHLALDT